MAKYSVNTDMLQLKANEMQTIQQGLNNVVLVLTAMRISDALKVSTSSILRRSIRNCSDSVMNQVKDLQKMQSCLTAIAELYNKTETKLLDPKTVGEAQAEGIAGYLWGWIDIPYTIPGCHFMQWWELIENNWAKSVPGNWQDRWPYISFLSMQAVLGFCATDDKDGGFLDDFSLLRGRLNLAANPFGIGCAGSLGFSFLGYEADGIGEAKWNMEEGNIGLEYGGKINGHLYKLDSESQVGIIGGKSELSVGNAELSGKINATLFEDGRFCPSIGIGAQGKASVLHGKAERYLGDEDYNLHVKADGTVLGAEAKADVGIGKVFIEDPDSKQMIEAYGLKAEVGAEAYIAEGKVSGGFTFMGIEVDASVSGKYGGAGVEAGGFIGVGGVSGEIGAGLGLGAGIEISIDWSNFDPPTLEEIGQGIQDIGQSIGEGVQNIGEGIQDAGEAIGEGLQDVGEAISDFFNW